MTKDRLAALDRAFKAISAARRHAHRTLGSGTPGTGQVVCPACWRGIITYSVIAPRGRMDGSCTTEGCVRWTNQ
jgi:hypothetical protein